MMRDTPSWPVDGHVHFHALDLVEPTLDAALRNFRTASRRTEGVLGALLLTQAAREHVFEALEVVPAVVGPWSLERARGERETLLARRGDACLAIVCGRQVRAADGLEVLALGTREAFEDGLPFEDVVARVRQSGALAVVPWGFGKWISSRGRRMEATLKSLGTDAVFVGDNGGRPERAGVPPRLRALAARGFRVLPGTDPFPFGGDCGRVGRFGFQAETAFDATAPWTGLRAWLASRGCSPKPYGRACGVARFMFNQVGIQFYNRFARGGPK